MSIAVDPHEVGERSSLPSEALELLSRAAGHLTRAQYRFHRNSAGDFSEAIRLTREAYSDLELVRMRHSSELPEDVLKAGSDAARLLESVIALA